MERRTKNAIDEGFKCQSKSHIQEEPGRVKNTDIMRLSEVWDPDWGKRDMCSFL